MEMSFEMKEAMKLLYINLSKIDMLASEIVELQNKAEVKNA